MYCFKFSDESRGKLHATSLLAEEFNCVESLIVEFGFDYSDLPENRNSLQSMFRRYLLTPRLTRCARLSLPIPCAAYVWNAITNHTTISLTGVFLEWVPNFCGNNPNRSYFRRVQDAGWMQNRLARWDSIRYLWSLSVPLRDPYRTQVTELIWAWLKYNYTRTHARAHTYKANSRNF